MKFGLVTIHHDPCGIWHMLWCAVKKNVLSWGGGIKISPTESQLKRCGFAFFRRGALLSQAWIFLATQEDHWLNWLRPKNVEGFFCEYPPVN